MTHIRKSKTNKTFFTDIQSKDDIEELKKFKLREMKLVQLKQQLLLHDKERKEIATKYLEYLKNNPFKAKKEELEKKVEQIRDELMGLIPDKWGAHRNG